MTHVQLGQILDQKTQKDKNPNCHLWRAGSKNWVLGAKQGAGQAPSTQHHKGVGKSPKPPSSLTPGHTPTLTPYKGWACPPCPAPAPGSKWENLFLVFAPSCSWHRSPSKALPEFLATSLREHNFPNPGWEEALLQVTPEGLVSLPWGKEYWGT